MALTRDVVRFARNEEGNLALPEPMEAPTAEVARRRATAAFSRTGDPSTGERGAAAILATEGGIDHGMPGEGVQPFRAIPFDVSAPPWP